MYEDDGELVLSPTDLTKHLACHHLTSLDLRAARKELTQADEPDEALELIFRLGLEHEAGYLERLKADGRTVVEIPDEPGVPERDRLAERVRLTEQALRAGADVVYQATFLHDGHRGHADFLLRTERPSLLGSWSYDVADTKLARKMKVAALLQMADYGRHLERLQGRPPEWLTVVTGDKEQRRFRYDEAAAYARRATVQLRAAVEAQAPTRPEPVAHCAQCRWAPHCQAQWKREDHLSLVAFMRTDHREALELAGLGTVALLAAAEPAALPVDIGLPARTRLQAQAGLQILERQTGTPHYELLEPAPGIGLGRLPEPSPGDVYLDFEGDPYAEGGAGREYLAGLWDRDGTFTPFWAHSFAEERTLTAELLADLTARLDADPGMHIYHYAAYERSALARLTQRHAVGEAEFDRLLRGETLVDLYAVVRQGLRISKGSYSIKKLEAFYWGGIRGSGDQPDDVADALASVVAYERWLVEGDDAILAGIEAYNSNDCKSTHALHTWLEERRAELESVHGPQPRPTQLAAPSQSLTDAEAEEAELVAKLQAERRALLAGLVGWHRREAKPEWWDFFRLGDLTDDELVQDSAGLGQLGAPENRGPLPKPKRSSIWRYPFPPQDTKVGGEAFDVDTHDKVGDVHDMDPAAGWIDIKFGNGKQAPSARGFGPSKPVDQRTLRESVQRTAAEVLGGGMPLGQRLLDRCVPDGLRRLPDEKPCDVVVRVGRGVRDCVLAVQGPPGSGKTRVGGELIRALLDDGLRVGVTAQSHAVIGNLLEVVGRRALQKCEADQHCGHDDVEQTGDNAVVLKALEDGTHNLIGGTAWLWARPDMTAAVDVLVIDEAGQFSLANAVAVSRGAKALVLLGDPQQLAQPSKAQHLDGSGASALEHILDCAATMPPDRGVFLDQTWRMHPELTKVVSGLMYEGRLGSESNTRHQQLLAPEPWQGTGIRWVPVPHTGNQAASSQEADVVRGIVDNLVGSTWVDREDQARPVTLDDVLIVAPYNAHVGRVRAKLPAGARVGTVDKFQGKEAPVVIYTMASSSADDAPRGVSFLYDLHRLNVAISRARCVAIVVGSPALLDAAVNSPDQLRSVNGLISVVEQAS